MPQYRLGELEENLKLLREQQAALERDALFSPEFQKTQAEQRLRVVIKPKIQEYEQEYQQILAAMSEKLEISEPDAQAVIAEIVEGVTQLEAQPANPEVAEMLQILRELRDKSQQPGKTATLKVKGMISTFPPFVGVFIEPEFALEAIGQKYLPTFTKLLRSVAKK